jgi:mannosyltransferase OCH1-like enzyme
MMTLEVEQRVTEIDEGEVKTVPGDNAFRKLHDRLKKRGIVSPRMQKPNSTTPLIITKLVKKVSAWNSQRLRHGGMKRPVRTFGMDAEFKTFADPGGFEVNLSPSPR